MEEYLESLPNDAKSQNFFILPTTAVKMLYDELYPLLGTELTCSILLRYGFRCGREIAKRCGVVSDSIHAAIDELHEIVSEMGISHFQVIRISPVNVEISVHDSIEATTFGPQEHVTCHFLKGCLAGVLSTLTNQIFLPEEVQCAATGAEACVIRLVTL